MRRINLAILLAFVLSAFTLAASALADDPVVTITLRDHQFVPAEVPVPAGVKVKLLIKNEQQVTAEFESASLHREKIVGAGGEIAVYVGPLSPGSYDIFDDFHRETSGRLVAK